jgi:hypothetical protein
MSRVILYVLNRYTHRFEYYNETEYSENFREHLVNTKCSFIVHPGRVPATLTRNRSELSFSFTATR